MTNIPWVYQRLNLDEYTFIDCETVSHDYKFGDHEIPVGKGSWWYFEIGDGMPEFYKHQTLQLIRNIPEYSRVSNVPHKGDIVTFDAWEFGESARPTHSFHNIWVRSLDGELWHTSPLNVVPVTIQVSTDHLRATVEYMKSIEADVNYWRNQTLLLKNDIKKLEDRLQFSQIFSRLWHKKAKFQRQFIDTFKDFIPNLNPITPEEENQGRLEAEQEQKRLDQLKIAQYEKITGLSSAQFLELWDKGEIEDSFDVTNWARLLGRDL